MGGLSFSIAADAIAGVLAQEWPQRVIYRDVCPAAFARPSFFLQCIKASAVTETRALWRCEAEFLLTLFDETDEYYDVSAERLLLVQERVLALFSGPVLAAGGFYPTLRAVSGEGRTPDAAFVSLHVDWIGSSPTFVAQQEEETAATPSMEEFAVAQSMKRSENA